MRGPSGLPLVAVVALATPACDVELQDVRVLPWQPEALAEGAGDLLDDAATIQVALTVDGEAQSFSLTDGRSVEGRVAAPTGSDVIVRLSSTGTSLPDATGASGVVRLEPGEGAVDAPLVLAPPGRVHTLSALAPDAREGIAACADDAGRVWIAGGNVGANTPDGSFVIDPVSRATGEGPALTGRTRASCVVDDGGGVYLLGGCGADDAATNELLYADTGDAGDAFELVVNVPNAGCDAKLFRAPGGDLVAFLGGSVAWINPNAPEVTSFSLSVSRHGGLVERLPDDGDGVLLVVRDGFSDAARTLGVAGASLIRVRPTSDATVTDFRPEPDATGRGRDGELIAVDGDSVVRLSADGGREVLVAGALNGDRPGSIAPVGDAGWAVLMEDGASVIVARPGADPTTHVVSPPRPGALLMPDPGGALRIVGGGVVGVAVLVVE